MKKIHILILSVLTFFIISSCRNNDFPEDIHEHEEIELIELTVSEDNNPSNSQLIKIVGGVATPELKLENGKSYNVGVDFLVKHEDHYHSALDEIEEEKEEHFLLYQFTGIDAKIVRSDDDITRQDGTKIGIKTKWTISSAPSTEALVQIKLNHGASTVSMNVPSVDNQLGEVSGGESDVDVKIHIK